MGHLTDKQADVEGMLTDVAKVTHLELKSTYGYSPVAKLAHAITIMIKIPSVFFSCMVTLLCQHMLYSKLTYLTVYIFANSKLHF